jgi:hypothetical protein
MSVQLRYWPARLAELKVGYVNTQRIFRDAPAAQKAGKKLEGEFAKRDQDLQRMAKQLQGMQENLEKNSVTMAESGTPGQGKGIRRVFPVSFSAASANSART